MLPKQEKSKDGSDFDDFLTKAIGAPSKKIDHAETTAPKRPRRNVRAETSAPKRPRRNVRAETSAPKRPHRNVHAEMSATRNFQAGVFDRGHIASTSRGGPL